MKTAIATVCLSGGLNEKLEAIAAAEFDGVEMFENDLLSFNGTPADVRRAIEELGLEPSRSSRFAISKACRRTNGPGFSACRAQVRSDAGAWLRPADDLLQRVAESLGGIDRAAADLRELGERAAKRGLRVAFEALAWGRHINDYRDAWEAVSRADHPAVGVVLDTFHILARKTDLSAIRSIPRDRIFLVQIADAPFLEMDYLSWSRHYRNFPGQGELPLLAFMAGLACDRLRWAAFTGDLQRPVPGRLGAQPCDRRTPLAYLSPRPMARATRNLAAPAPLPPRSRALGPNSSSSPSTRQRHEVRRRACRAWFSAGRPPQIEVGDALAAGRHQSRRQHREGRLCALLQYHPRLRGLRARPEGRQCSRDLRAGDAAARSAVSPARRPGELDIPAVRGVGGSLVYFLDAESELGGFGISSSRRPARRLNAAGLPRSTISRSRCTTKRC